MISPTLRCYSSTVELHLIVGGAKVGLSQIGPGYVVLENPQELPPADAEVVMSIDGNLRSWPVRLVHGAVPYDEKVEIVDQI